MRVEQSRVIYKEFARCPAADAELASSEEVEKAFKQMLTAPDNYLGHPLVGIPEKLGLSTFISSRLLGFQHPFTSYWRRTVENGRGPIPPATMNALRGAWEILRGVDSRFDSFEAALLAPYLCGVGDASQLVRAAQRMVIGNLSLAKMWIAFQTGHLEFGIDVDEWEDLALLEGPLLECHQAYLQEACSAEQRQNLALYLSAPFLSSHCGRPSITVEHPLEKILFGAPEILTELFDNLMRRGLGPKEWKRILLHHSDGLRLRWPKLIGAMGSERLADVASSLVDRPLVPPPTLVPVREGSLKLLHELGVNCGRLPKDARQPYVDLLSTTCRSWDGCYTDTDEPRTQLLNRLGLDFSAQAPGRPLGQEFHHENEWWPLVRSRRPQLLDTIRPYAMRGFDPNERARWIHAVREVLSNRGGEDVPST